MSSCRFTLIATERKLEQRSRLSIKLLRWLEWLSLRLPDLLIQDTAEYVTWLGDTFGLAARRFRLVATGADDRVFQPLPARQPDGTLRAIYYGTFIPNHRVNHIIEAACLLKGEMQFQFELIGTGPERDQAAAMVEQYGLQSQVKMTDWLSQEELVKRVAQADVCLGAFGFTPQSLMTVQNKIYEGMAMGRAVVTGDSPAIKAQFEQGVHLMTCDRSDAESLAQALRQLAADPALCQKIARQGLEWFQTHATIRHLGEQFRQHLDSS